MTAQRATAFILGLLRVAGRSSLPLLFAVSLVAFSTVASSGAPLRREWVVDGVQREALICTPIAATSQAVPVVFVFHGHGGTMQHAARTFALHSLWREALVVYPQGLKTPGRLTDPEGKKSGWQHAPGDQDDRDLKFFDVMLASLLRDHPVDRKRAYATGHSNGGAFSYLLWTTRPDRFTAFAPSAAVFPLLVGREGRAGLKNPESIGPFQPKPALHLAGRNDPLVKFAWQRLMMDALRERNQCGEAQPWEKQCLLYPSKVGAPVVTFIHAGAHEFPAEAPALIVKFFQQHAGLGK